MESVINSDTARFLEDLHLLRSGVSIEAAQSQAGHTSSKTTEIYTDEIRKSRAREVRSKSKRFIED